MPQIPVRVDNLLRGLETLVTSAADHSSQGHVDSAKKETIMDYSRRFDKCRWDQFMMGWEASYAGGGITINTAAVFSL